MDDPLTIRLIQTILEGTYIQQMSYVYTFLHLALKTYTTASQWTNTLPQFYAFLENPGFQSTRLPYLDLSTRASAKREKKKYALQFQNTTNERPHQSAEFFKAMFWIRRNGPF
jgi:hypothetical protein